MKPFWELELVMESDGILCAKCGTALPFAAAKLVKTESWKFNRGSKNKCFCMKCGVEELVPKKNLLAVKRLADMGFDISGVSSLVESINQRNGFALEAK